jgi:hypothetical protein
VHVGNEFCQADADKCYKNTPAQLTDAYAVSPIGFANQNQPLCHLPFMVTDLSQALTKRSEQNPSLTSGTASYVHVGSVDGYDQSYFGGHYHTESQTIGAAIFEVLQEEEESKILWSAGKDVIADEQVVRAGDYRVK